MKKLARPSGVQINWRPINEATGAARGTAIFPVGAVVTIGRGADNDIVLQDSEVSRNHARLAIRGSEVIFTDLKTKNGSRIDGRLRLGSASWRPGQTLQIGDHLLEVEPHIEAGATIPMTMPARGAVPEPRLRGLDISDHPLDAAGHPGDLVGPHVEVSEATHPNPPDGAAAKVDALEISDLPTTDLGHNDKVLDVASAPNAPAVVEPLLEAAAAASPLPSAATPTNAPEGATDSRPAATNQPPHLRGGRETIAEPKPDQQANKVDDLRRPEREQPWRRRLMVGSVAAVFLILFAGGGLFYWWASYQIKVGVAGPMTGPEKAKGDNMALGVKEAIADINASGGINGHLMEPVIMDDQGDAKQGEAVAKRMAAAGVKIVIGHINSGVTLPASLVYADNGILMITPASTIVEITERNLWNVFRTCGRDDQQGEVAGKYIAEKFNGMKIAVVHDGTLYGKGLADFTRSTMLKTRGLSEVLYDKVDVGTTDMSALVNKLKASGAQVVYWGGLHSEGGGLLRQMRAAGVTAVMMSGDGITTEEFATISGASAVDTLMTYHADPEKRPEARGVVAKLREKNIKPGVFTFYSYAALQIAVAAANEAKTLDTKRIAETIRSGKAWPTVIGPVAYNKKGDITRSDYVMYTWKKGTDGKITYVEN